MNPYYNPEDFGLSIVGSLEDPEACYTFNYLVAWGHDESGKVYWAKDSGCSCPTPFEDFYSLEDLTLVTNETWGEFQKAVESHCCYDPDTLAADRTALLSRVSAMVPR